MNYPWRPAAVRNIYADSAASTSSLPSDHPSNNLPITVGTVASRISFLQKLAGNQKNKSPPKPPSRFPQSRPIRREKSNKSPQIRPQLNRRRENSRSSFGRRPTNIFGTPASRNSQPNEQPQSGTNHSFWGLQTPRSNHDKGHARAGFNGTPRPDAYIGGVQPGGLHGMVQADASACSWAPATETLKPSIKNLDQKITGHGVCARQGIQRLEDRSIYTQIPSNPQTSKQRIRVSSPHRQNRKRLQGEILNSETSTHTTSTLRRQSVRELFDKYGIERPPGLASSEMVREEVNKPQRYRVCHLCMWIHDKNEDICWKCGHRLCKACDKLSPFRGRETRFDYDKVLSGNQLESTKSSPYATTPRPANIQIMKNSTTRPMSNPLQTNKKEFRRKQKLNPTEPFPSFYSKKSPSPKNLNGRGTNPAFYGPLNSCPGIYIPEKFQKSKSRPGDSSKAQHLPPITESPRQYITNNHNSSTQPPEGHGSRCESCQPTDYRSFVCRHPTSPSLARSEDVLAMGGDYTSDNSNSENIYRSHSHPNSSKASQPSTRFYRLLNGSIHRATHLSHDSDGQDIPRTSTRSYKFATGPMQRKTHTSYERDLKDHTKKSRQTLVNSYPPLSKPTYQPVQPNFESDHTQDPQPSDSLYPFRNETISEVAQSEYGSDYVECRGYPRTGHWDCDRSPVSSGVLGDCQHCLDDCECSACQSTVHSVRCCTNEIHKSMIHHHHSPTKNSLNASCGSSAGQLSSERKPYILSHSQTYDRSTVQKYDSISEWLGSPDGPSPQRLETTKITPTEAVQISKDNTFIAITKVNDSSATPPSWGPSLKPITPKSITPLMKKALNKTSKDASLKARANLNRASSSDGTKYHPIAPVRSSNRNSIQASPEYSASDSWREIEIINFSKRYDHWEKPSTSPLEQVSKNTTHCDISDVCGQSNWVEQRQKSPSNLRKGVKRRTELEKIQQKIHRWEDKKSESRRGRDTITATASEMTTPVSRGYFDAQMRWCSSESMQGRRGNGGIGFMGSIEEEEVEMESVENGEGYDCVWRRVIDLSDKGRGHGSRDEVKRGMEGIGGVKGVTIVIHMESGEDLVLRTNSGGKLNWEGLEGLLRVRSGA